MTATYGSAGTGRYCDRCQVSLSRATDTHMVDGVEVCWMCFDAEARDLFDGPHVHVYVGDRERCSTCGVAR